eukprot:TRINITY_DN11277_c0_g1_i2.p1 TRINITY_DN11277_c0_g1~~TRINITY_DN11277_c0_g1_i2.p1  ORF type:complete len:470 (-),score=100.04 TRINITY_DN11277_c0_g1_i2:61-1470(-)
MHSVLLPSPTILPRIVPESPVIFPVQFDEPYNFTERRRSSFHNESDVMEAGRGTLKTAQETHSLSAQNEPNALPPLTDSDGFKRPKAERKGQESLRRKNADTRLISHMLSPAMLPERDSPFIQPEEMKGGLRLMSLNAAIAASTPLLNPTLIAPPYSPEAMRYIQTGVFGCQSDGGGASTRDYHRKDSECTNKADEVPNEELQPGYFCSPCAQATPEYNQLPDQDDLSQDNFQLDNSEEPKAPTEGPSENTEKAIGGITITERQDKIRKYLEKRKRRIWRKKVHYDCRKKVADKRLRIKGRFVTRDQAYALLGATAEDLARNELLRTLVADKEECSIVTSANNMRIRNLQTLFMAPEKKSKKDVSSVEKPLEIEIKKNLANGAKSAEKQKLRVEILKNNSRERVVEIKIETLLKGDNAAIQEQDDLHPSDGRLPKISNPIFQFKRLAPSEFHPGHSKYHKYLESLMSEQ